MGREEALQIIISLAASGRVAYTDHALFDKMPPLGISRDDVVHCLMHPVSFARSDEYHHASDWTVGGVDLDGNALTVGVVIESDVLVITVF